MKYITSVLLAFAIMLTSAPLVLAGDKIEGVASNYAGTAGFIGTPGVALPGRFGGAYTGHINGYVTVCADRCATFPIIDWCYCHVPNSNHPYRIVDLNYQAWDIISDKPLAEGIIPVTIELNRKPKSNPTLPDTALSNAR